jgi:hypothetical protein
MKFTPAEIELARRLKQLGLAWTPSVGHFVWDETGLINCTSPFHDYVYFILDLKHFLRRAGTIERLQQDSAGYRLGSRLASYCANRACPMSK